MIPATMRKLAEAELAKMYRQWARGRAIVRTNSMREARQLKAQLDRNSRYTGTLAMPLSKAERSILLNRLIYTVRRARQANNDWRRYRRQMHDALKEGL